MATISDVRGSAPQISTLGDVIALTPTLPSGGPPLKCVFEMDSKPGLLQDECPSSCDPLQESKYLEESQYTEGRRYFDSQCLESQCSEESQYIMDTRCLSVPSSSIYLQMVSTDNQRRNGVLPIVKVLSCIKQIFGRKKCYPIHLYLMAIAATLTFIGIISTPVAYTNSHPSQSSQLALSESYRTALVIGEPSDDDYLQETTKPSIDWGSIPYVLLSIGYLLFSVSGTWISWRSWGFGDFEALPFQCCLAVGNALSAFLSFLLQQPEVKADDAGNLLDISGFLNTPSFLNSSNFQSNDFDLTDFIERWAVALIGSALLLGGCCRALGSLGLLRIAKRRHESYTHFGIHILTAISGALYAAAVVLLLRCPYRGNSAFHCNNSCPLVVYIQSFDYRWIGSLDADHIIYSWMCSSHHAIRIPCLIIFQMILNIRTIKRRVWRFTIY